MSSLTRDRVLKLRAEGLTFVEIADRLCLTKGQVSGLVFRASKTHTWIRAKAKAEQAKIAVERAVAHCAKECGPEVARQVCAAALRQAGWSPAMREAANG